MLFPFIPTHLRRIATVALAIGVVFVPTPAALAQFGGFHVPKLPIPDSIPVPAVPNIPVPALGLPSLDMLTNNDPVTSSFSDAVTAVPFLDGYSPTITVPLVALKRDQNGAFHTYPGGAFDFAAQSYCMHAGTYGPGHGEGYLFAPIKGPRAAIINHLLLNSVTHPEVEQHSIQILIWAILSRTKFGDMPAEMQKTAATLLTPLEIADLSGNALGIIPDNAREKLLGSLPGSVRSVLNAENSLRSLLTSAAGATYDELASVAVLTGNPPSDNSPAVPRGRWSFLPAQNVFVRYVPDNYTQTVEQIAVPGTRLVERDTKGRISQITDTAGNTLSLTYKENVLTPVANGAKAWAFHTVTFGIHHASPTKPDPVPELIWANQGYTILNDMLINMNGAYVPGFPSSGARIVAAGKQLQQTLDALGKMGIKINKNGTDPDVETLRDLAYLKAAMDDLAKNNTHPTPADTEPARLVTEAWMDTFARTVSGATLAANRTTLRASVFCPGGNGGNGYNPGGGAAMPAEPSRQRLAQSARPGVNFHPIGESPDGKAIQSACASHGIPASDVASYTDADGNWHYAVRTGGNDNHPLPTMDDVQNSGTNNNEGAKNLALFSVQQAGGQTRVGTRSDNVETGEVHNTGTGTVNGTDSDAVTQAANQAIDNSGNVFGGHKP